MRKLTIFSFVFALSLTTAYYLEETLEEKYTRFVELEKRIAREIAALEEARSKNGDSHNSDDGKYDEYWSNQKDEKKHHRPKLYKDKLQQGHKLKQSKEDKFENEFGRYKERKDTTILDLISTINLANDITSVEEGDIVASAPSFNYKEQLGNINGDGNGKGHNNGNKSPRGKRQYHRKKEEMWEIRKRDAKRDRVYLWVNRIVPYEIDSALMASADTIRNAMQQLQSKTCITFKKHTTEKNWIKFVKKSGCWSSVGRTFWREGYQEISLGPGCISKGIIMHEILHALGFWHEQSRPDRDKYVEIFWENISTENIHNFNKYGHGVIDLLKAPYDFNSIMHYGKYSFAIDSQKPTILSITNPSTSLGQRDHLSDTDIFQINELYECKNQGTGWSNWSEYSPCDRDCMKYRTRFCMDPVDSTACLNPVATNHHQYGADISYSDCPDAECNAPINGHWNRWGSWGDCSVSCDNGLQTRKRLCTDPEPKNGGNHCVGSDTSTQPCQKKSCSAGPNDCTFDIAGEPTCSWTQDQDYSFDWSRYNKRTPSSSTGPDNDHTSGSGYYLFIESSAPAQTGWKARLLSKEMSASPRCMTFAYNMYGMSIGELNVYVKDRITNVESRVFTKSGDQLKGWHVDSFDISAINTYQVIIEGIRGSGFQGDIAIDDLSIKHGTCAGGVKPDSTPPPLPTVERVGCYHSKGYINGKRLFSQSKNFRNDIVWERMNKTLTEITKKCAAFARTNNYEYFAIEYWGECWTGPTDQINYGRDGEADDCWPKKSENLGPHLVGMEYTAMVYKWV